MNKKLVALQDELIAKLKQLEATPEETDHILHLHGQKICSIVQMEEEPDSRAANEFVNAYYNQEPWVTSIPFGIYADMLLRKTLEYYRRKQYSPQKAMHLLLTKPDEWMSTHETYI